MTDKTRALTPKTIWKLGLLLLILVLGFFGYQWLTYARPLLSEAADSLVSDDLVTVSAKPMLTFTPTQDQSTTGFIFYPGGRVATQGYAPLLKPIAAAGYLVVVPDMPLHIAAFRPNVADKIIAAYPEISRWVIGGHSVGGAMAAQYTYTHRDNVAGLVIWASYPPEGANLSEFELPVASIYGSLDPGVNDSSIAERYHLLPADTVYVRVDGGDHHQFGTYKINPADHHATLDRASQQEQIVTATLDVLASFADSE